MTTLLTLTAAVIAVAALLAVGAVVGVLGTSQRHFDFLMGQQHDGPEWDAR